MLMAVIVETFYLSGTLYPSLHYPQDIPFGGFESLYSPFYWRGDWDSTWSYGLPNITEQNLYSNICHMSFQWNMLKILIIRWLIKMMESTQCHYNDSYTLTLTAKCSIFFVSLSNVRWKNTFKERPWEIPSVKKKCWTISSSNMLTDSLRFLLVAQI